MPGGALKDHTVTDRVPVAIGAAGRVFHLGHAGGGEDDGSSVHAAGDLIYYVVEYVVEAVAVAQNTTCRPMKTTSATIGG